MPSLESRRTVVFTSGAAALASLLTLTSACSTPAAAAAPEREPATVQAAVAVAEARAVPRTISLTGTLLAAREADVAAVAAGKVIAVAVDRGDAVAAGAPLARLDARAAALAGAEANASAQGLIAQKQSAELDCARAERLLSVNVISQAEYDRTTAGCRTSGHSADAALARAGLAQKTLSDAVIRAPFRGVVAERAIEVGDYVNAGGKVVTLVDASTLKLELAVPETAIPHVHDGRVVTFAVAAYPDREFSGKVTRLSPSLRRASRDQLVEVAVDNADGALRPGMFATARVTTGEDRYPVVPTSAVTGRAPSERVFVVKADARVEERVVATGDRVGSGIAVVRGVQAGERVVVAPKESVKDGVKVAQ